VALHGIEGMGAATFDKLVTRFGSPRDVLTKATKARLAGLSRLPVGLAEGIAEARGRIDDAERLIESLAADGIRIVTIEDGDYPALLRRIRRPPPLLYCRGEVTDADASAVAIVGSTHPSAEGRKWARGFARRLAEAGHTVVSGYAHGIDSAAHLGAIEGGGRSLFVLPTGIRRFEPRRCFPEASALAANGAILSECPPDQEWTTPAALARNRITAGLSRAVLVIEARRKSGTMATFKIARREGIPCFVLRYDNPPPTALGNAVAIADGGTPVTSYADLDKIIDALAPEKG